MPKKFGLFLIGTLFLLCLFLLLLFWRNSSMSTQENKIRYVSLGDSYSNGEGESPDKAWPALLTKHLQEEGYTIDLVVNPSVSGWTTQDLIDKELPIFIEARPTFATLLIGANDIARSGADPEVFHTNLITILDTMQENMPDKKKIILVTIPDFSVTPQGLMYLTAEDGEKIIGSFNKIIKEEGERRGLPVVDIFELTREMGQDRNLVTADGLHPSAKELQLWEEKIFPVAKKLLNE